MYSIYMDGKILHEPRLKEDGLVVVEPTLENELNKAGSLKFTITPNNQRYSQCKKMKSIIQVFDNGNEIFRGRILDDTEDFYKRRAVVCEGDLNFLLDSLLRPYSFQGDIPDFAKTIIENHNAQVEEAKRFELGKVTISDSNNYINRSSVNYTKTLDVINEKIIDTHGGYIDTRKENGTYYVDFLADYERVNSQTIEFKKNLLDITKYITAENIYTVLIPLGALQEVSSTAEGETVQKRLTIESVNDGKDYIYSQTAINLFGMIWRTETFDDVTLPENLLAKGIEKLNENIELSITLKLRAVDLHLLDVNVQRLRKGDYVRVISKPHGLDTYFQLTKINLKLANPDQSTYEFGVSYSSLTEKTISGNKAIKQATAAANESSERANQSLTKVENVIVKMEDEYVTTELFQEFKSTLGTASKAGISNVLTNTNSGYVLDARVGQTILNMMSNLEGKIPTKLSDLDDDVGYLKEHQSLENYVTRDEFNKLSIPTKVSELENDENFINEDTLNGYVKNETFEERLTELEDRIKTLEETNGNKSEEGGIVE